MVSEVLGESIPPDQPLMEAGLDSIGAVELRNTVAAKFGVELPATVTFDYPTLDALAQFVASKVAPEISSGEYYEPMAYLSSAANDQALRSKIAEVEKQLLDVVRTMSLVVLCRDSSIL